MPFEAALVRVAVFVYKGFVDSRTKSRKRPREGRIGHPLKVLEKVRGGAGHPPGGPPASQWVSWWLRSLTWATSPPGEKPTAAREAAMRQPREDFLEV